MEAHPPLFAVEVEDGREVGGIDATMEEEDKALGREGLVTASAVSGCKSEVGVVEGAAETVVLGVAPFETLELVGKCCCCCRCCCRCWW